MMNETHDTVPHCVGMIMDGNRRWAKQRLLPTVAGHQRGLDTLKKMTLAARDRGISHVVVYAFSTENWKRSEEEVTFMLDLIRERFGSGLTDELGREGVRIRVIGQHEKFPEDIQRIFADSESATAHNDRITLWICASYGGRAEIVAAAKALERAHEAITEESLAGALWSAGMPDPDIIIRTGGQRRLSNFLLWQSTYSELFFLDTYWPDLDEHMLDDVLKEFAQRKRNFGK